jgi:hypothetical protein
MQAAPGPFDEVLGQQSDFESHASNDCRVAYWLAYWVANTATPAPANCSDLPGPCGTKTR